MLQRSYFHINIIGLVDGEVYIVEVIEDEKAE